MENTEIQTPTNESIDFVSDKILAKKKKKVIFCRENINTGNLL